MASYVVVAVAVGSAAFVGLHALAALAGRAAFAPLLACLSSLACGALVAVGFAARVPPVGTIAASVTACLFFGVLPPASVPPLPLAAAVSAGLAVGGVVFLAVSWVVAPVWATDAAFRATGGALDALAAGFPAGTLSGAPKVRAMEIIEELEPDRRNIYAGCIGYFAANGTMDTCIGLRTALVKDGTMYVQAGAGVVADSVPEAEYEETRQKARALVRAAEEAVRFAAGKGGANAG